MKNLIRLLISLVAFFILTGCNTISGVGKDIESAGDGIQDAAN